MLDEFLWVLCYTLNIQLLDTMLVARSALLEDNVLGILLLFPKPSPATIKDTLEEHSYFWISPLENVIHFFLITLTSDDEAQDKDKSIEGMQLFFLLNLECKHRFEVWRESAMFRLLNFPLLNLNYFLTSRLVNFKLPTMQSYSKYLLVSIIKMIVILYVTFSAEKCIL